MKNMSLFFCPGGRLTSSDCYIHASVKSPYRLRLLKLIVDTITSSSADHTVFAITAAHNNSNYAETEGITTTTNEFIMVTT